MPPKWKIHSFYAESRFLRSAPSTLLGKHPKPNYKIYHFGQNNFSLFSKQSFEETCNIPSNLSYRSHIFEFIYKTAPTGTLIFTGIPRSPFFVLFVCLNFTLPLNKESTAVISPMIIVKQDLPSEHLAK